MESASTLRSMNITCLVLPFYSVKRQTGRGLECVIKDNVNF